MHMLCVVRELQPIQLVIHVSLDFAKLSNKVVSRLEFKAQKMRGVLMVVEQLVLRWRLSLKNYLVL